MYFHLQFMTEEEEDDGGNSSSSTAAIVAGGAIAVAATVAIGSYAYAYVETGVLDMSSILITKCFPQQPRQDQALEVSYVLNKVSVTLCIACIFLSTVL